ncbi:hypothetical protein V8C44DRAFT_315141 [Trichoderma aethiopicum]
MLYATARDVPAPQIPWSSVRLSLRTAFREPYNSKYYVTLLDAASSGANSLVLRRRTSSGHVRDNDSALTKNY